MGLFSSLRAPDAPSLFDAIGKAIEVHRAIQADELTLAWLAGEVASRTDMTAEQAASFLAGIATSGGPDLRTSKGWACASIILGVPGAPVIPTLH